MSLTSTASGACVSANAGAIEAVHFVGTRPVVLTGIGAAVVDV